MQVVQSKKNNRVSSASMVGQHSYRTVHVTSKTIFLAQDYWNRLNVDGLARTAFPEKDVRTMEEFTSMAMDNYNVLLIVIDRNNEPTAHVNLNGFKGMSALVHFSILKKWHGPLAIQMARNVCRQIFESERTPGVDYLRTLIGVTPVRNKLACKFIKRVGFKSVGTVQGCVITDDSFEDAMLSLLHKGEV